ERIMKPAPGEPAAGPPVTGSVAVSVVRRPFLVIREDFVSLARFLELFLGRLITGIFVRMEFYGLLAVSLFDFLRRSAFLEAEDLVVVAFGHRSGSRFFGDDHAGRTEQALTKLVTFAHLLDNRALRRLSGFLL